MTVKWLLLFVITQWPLYSNGIDQLVVVDESTNPMELSRQICINSRDSCQNLVLPLIQLEKYSLFNIKLDNWRHNEACGCLLPPQTKQSYLQYFHIPKSGTSINWFFRDYFENCNDEVNVRVNVSGDPCPTWLETVSTAHLMSICLSHCISIFSCKSYLPLFCSYLLLCTLIFPLCRRSSKQQDCVTDASFHAWGMQSPLIFRIL